MICPTRLPSQFHHDAFHDLENGAKKKTACLFVQNGPVSEKDRDLVGFVWVSFTNPSKKDTITKTFCSCSCIRTLERKSASLAETICRQGMVPSPESIHSSVKQVQVFWCSGTFENTTNKNGWFGYRSCVLQFFPFKSSTTIPLLPWKIQHAFCLIFLSRSVSSFRSRTSWYVVQKTTASPPKKKVGFSVTSEHQRVEEKLQGLWIVAPPIPIPTPTRIPWSMAMVGWSRSWLPEKSEATRLVGKPLRPNQLGQATRPPSWKGWKNVGHFKPTGLDVWKLVGK